MRVSSFAVARPAYYDRNATTGVFSYDAANIAPHSLTTRWTTTVAAGKKAFVESGTARLIRYTAATLAGQANVQIQVTSGATQIDLFNCFLYSNTVNTLVTGSVPTQVTLYAGETLAATTADASTGGTTYIGMFGKTTTFDA